MPLQHAFVQADGVRIFYREAGSPAAPVLLLLHGFPASSFQYRELMQLLAAGFHLIAPDLPGFGYTEVPPERHYTYTFDAIAKTIQAFTEELKLDRYALYVFDYGAPTGFRLALANPERVTAIITQNGKPTRRAWVMPGIRSAATGASLRWRTGKLCVQPLRWMPSVGSTRTA